MLVAILSRPEAPLELLGERGVQLDPQRAPRLRDRLPHTHAPTRLVVVGDEQRHPGVEERLQVGTTDLYAEYQALTDRHLFALVLRHTGGNLSQASRLLGITRATLRAKLAALGMRAERSAADEDAG